MVETIKKITIDENNYIKILSNGNFEIHCKANGPLGANVYLFENKYGGLLKCSQRRSYSGVSNTKYY